MRKTAVIYTRVSTDEQAKTGYSLGHQQHILTEFCKLKDIDIIYSFQEDYSAKNFERPAYRKLLAYCKAKKNIIDYVLVSKWDRYSRNQGDALNEIKRMSGLGIEVNAIEQWIDFSIPQNKMMLSIFLTLPEIDNDIRGLNTKMGMRRSKKEGRWIGKAPFGYKNGRDLNNKPILVIDEEKANLVKESFDKFSTGLYDKEELRRMMSIKGLVLGKSQFPKFLANSVYASIVTIPKSLKEPEESIQGIHVPIISVRTFNKVQSLLGRKCLLGQNANVDYIEEAPLRAIMKCHKCGKPLTSSKSKGRNRYYHYYHCHTPCDARLKIEDAHVAIDNYLKSIIVAPEILSLYEAILNDIYDSKQSSNVKESNQLELKLNQTSEKLYKLEEKYIY